MRYIVFLIAGVLLGVIIHISVILALPMVATHTVWSRIAAIAPENRIVVLPSPAPGVANPLQLDPGLEYAVCRVNLAAGPGEISGTLPDAYWSLAIFDPSGRVIYSTTNRDGIGQNLNLGIFNPDQTHLLAEQRLDIADGLLIIESPGDDVFVVVRLAPAHEAVRARSAQALARIACGNIKS